MMAREDFVNVKLTKFGKQAAGGAPIQVHAGNHSFYFEPDEVKMVTRAFEWERVLKNEHFNGHPLFEIAFSKEDEQEHVAELRAEGIDATATPDGILVKELKIEEVGN
jgi:hypothetical protein